MGRASQGLLDNFWLRMAGMFGHTWVSQFGASPTGLGADTWSATIADLSKRQIQQGMSACLASGADWPPSAPKFRAMCLGIPSLAMVTGCIHGRSEATPFSRLVWSKMDTHRFRTESADSGDRLIRDAYEMAKDHVMTGGHLPEIAGLIERQPEPERVIAAPEVAKPHIDSIRQFLRQRENDDEA